MTDADKQLARDYFPAFRDRDEAWWERFGDRAACASSGR